jgi:hypothetical protein
MNFGTLTRPALLATFALFAGRAAVAQDVSPAAEPQETPAEAVAPEPAKDLKYANKWRIEVHEGANNDGVARFRVTPKGEAAIEVTVNVKDGRSENGVAADVRDAFKAALDKKRFHVEIDDGEDVLVKKKGGPDLAIELLESNLKGTHFKLERE